jgi:arylsulfatase A-like enzyme
MITAALGAVLLSQQAKQPNIVVLFSDDAGWADFGFQRYAADDVKDLTPHIDKLAHGGMIAHQGYMSGVVCSPSRAGLMTGKYQSSFGHQNNIPPGYMRGGMSLEETTVADRLSDLGYTTGLIGKWHLGYPGPYQPNKRGFDLFHGLLQGSRGYHPYENPTAHRVIQINGEPQPEEGYVTDRFGDAAVSFIKSASDEPFFLFVSFTSPHGPLQPRKEDEDWLEELEFVNPRRRRYAGLISSLDDNVGKVMAALKTEGIDDDTLVIFTNDNGGQTQVGANNGPLHGRKGTVYEGGSRVPMAFRWPGQIEAGSDTETPIISLDFLPTFVDLAGGKAEGIDGLSLTSLLKGDDEDLGDRELYWRSGGRADQNSGDDKIAIRDGDWKLVWNRVEGADAELYDLEDDLGETKDLASEKPEIVKRLKAKLAKWEKGLMPPLWGGIKAD